LGFISDSVFFKFHIAIKQFQMKINFIGIFICVKFFSICHVQESKEGGRQEDNCNNNLQREAISAGSFCNSQILCKNNEE